MPRHLGLLLTHVARMGTVGCIVAGLIAAPAHVGAQVRQPDQDLREKEAVAYVNSHADREDMVMVPMRDGELLYNLILFPKGQPRQNLPAVLIHIPYLIDPNHTSELFAPFIQSFIEHGYAIVWQSERGRYFSRGHYTYLSARERTGSTRSIGLRSNPGPTGR